jgi:hypothetical protein
MKLLRVSIVMVSALVVLLTAGCISYSSSPLSVSGEKDVYTISVSYNMYVSQQTVAAKRDARIQETMTKYGYKDYRVLDVKSAMLGGKNTYRVKFYRSKLEPAE